MKFTGIFTGRAFVGILFSMFWPLAYPIPLLVSQGKYAEAEPLYRRSQAIRERVLGPDHVVVATVLNNRAGLLTIQVRGKTMLLLCRQFSPQILLDLILTEVRPCCSPHLKATKLRQEPLCEWSQGMGRNVLGHSDYTMYGTTLRRRLRQRGMANT